MFPLSWFQCTKKVHQNNNIILNNNNLVITNDINSNVTTSSRVTQLPPHQCPQL